MEVWSHYYLDLLSIDKLLNEDDPYLGKVYINSNLVGDKNI